MRLDPLSIDGAFLVHPDPVPDERGLFARVWCAEEFARHGISTLPVQSNTGFSPRAGTLRGLHYQVAPALEAKLVRCTRGGVFDVIVDLRDGSPTQGQWFGTELTADNRAGLYVPPLCAHGYLTLLPDTELEYLATAPYTPGAARGLRHDDPAIGIRWPAPVTVISERDSTWALLDAEPTP